MIFIVESGSTKSDWVLVNAHEKRRYFTTMGFNPFFHSSAFISDEIRKNDAIHGLADEVNEIYFYGAGCSSPAKNDVILVGLSTVFKNAKIHVDHDLVACAYATYQGKNCISCIIGTGSNSCYFDGKTVSDVIPALGYVLGDEGSGSYFGKKLLAAYLYGHLTVELSADFEQTFGLNKEQILDKVYKESNANVFIASFMPFVAKHKSHPFFQQMIEEGFYEFMRVHVGCYPDFTSVDVHFVGSLAAIFEDSLVKAAKRLSIHVASIIQKPVDGLVDYHLNYLLDKKYENA